MRKKNSGLVLESSLQAYFYDRLHEINKKVSPPLMDETIFYSSVVMDQFGDSNKYFEIVDGRVREKILGPKFLETQLKNKAIKKRELKDIGDTALFLCGYFSDSLNRKIIDNRYYKEIGVMAYQNLNQIVPSELKVPSFYKILSKSFDRLATIMGIVAHEVQTSQKNAEESAFFVSIKPRKAS